MATAAKQAHRQIRKFGRTLTYVDAAEDAFVDGSTLEVVEAPAPSEYAAKGLVRRVRQSWVDGTLVHATDMEILVPRLALAVTPRQGGRVEMGGRTLTVVDVRPMSSGELDWGYYMIVRA